MSDTKSLPRKKIKNYTLLRHLEREYHRKRKQLDLMEDKEAACLVLAASLWFIVERNRGAIDSLRFSEFLKHEPYIDHWFFKLASEYGRTRNDKKNHRKTKSNRFGIFNIKK